jgi:hypothetical protein
MRSQRFTLPILSLLVWLAPLGCGDEAPAELVGELSRGPSRKESREIRVDPLATLLDDSAAILARPGWVSESLGGGFVIADPSDKNVKRYAADGHRTGTVGHVGYGPGEFTSLNNAQAYRDSVLAYDFGSGRVSIFAPDGTLARTMSVARDYVARPWSVRVVDDSLFLLIGAPPGGDRLDLLALIRPDGSKVSSFFNRARYFDGDPKLLQRVAVAADGLGGRVYAALVGGDSLYVYDYGGRLLGSHPLDAERPLVPVKTLLRRNRGKVTDARGRPIVDGNRNAVRLVALDSSTVAVQITVYDARLGTDALEGGTLVLSSVNAAGRMHTVARAEVRAGLSGRDLRGNALLLGYGPRGADEYVLSRLRLPRAGGGDR